MHWRPLVVGAVNASSHWSPMRVTAGAQVFPGWVQAGRVGRASVTVSCPLCQLHTGTLPLAVLVVNSQARSPSTATKGSGASASRSGLSRPNTSRFRGPVVMPPAAAGAVVAVGAVSVEAVEAVAVEVVEAMVPVVADPGLDTTNQVAVANAMTAMS